MGLAGPFAAKQNDATLRLLVVREVLRSSSLRLLGFLRVQVGVIDILIVDRGFSTAVDFMTSQSSKLLMPAMLNEREQLPTEEAIVASRWYDGWLKLFAESFRDSSYCSKRTVNNKMLSKIQTQCS